MEDIRRRCAVVLVGAMVLSLTSPLGAGLVGAVPDARVAVTDATVTPTTPTAGAPITVESTVRLSGGSSTAVTLDSVEIRTADGDVVGEATGLGSLSPGETLSVPVSVTVDTPREYELTVVATASEDDDEQVTARRPLPLVVEQGAPQVELDAPNPVETAESTVRATVSNPTAVAFRNLTVTMTNPAAGERVRRTVPQLAAGTSTTVNFSVRPGDAGETDVTARIEYTTASGTVATRTHERSITVDPLSDDVGVRVGEPETADGGSVGGATTGGLAGIIGGGGSALQSSGDGASEETVDSQVGVTVTNFGNAAIEDVVIVPQSDNGSVVGDVGRFAVADRLEPGASETVQIGLQNAETLQAVDFVTRYDLAGNRRSTVTGYDRLARGAVELTGVNISVDGDGDVRFSGNLANVGNGEISGVVVTVPEGAYARPAYPQRSYFVGAVSESEFAPFQLTARVDAANTSSIPVRVAYTVGDERVTETTMVQLPAREQSSSGVLSVAAGFGETLLVVGLAVPLAVGLLVRRYR